MKKRPKEKSNLVNKDVNIKIIINDCAPEIFFTFIGSMRFDKYTFFRRLNLM